VIRVNTFLKKNPQLSQSEFHDYWLTKHSVVATGTPSWFHYVRKYVQTHTAHEDNPPDVVFDGIAQLTLDDFAAFSEWKALPELEVIWADEYRVFDPPNLMWVISRDVVLAPTAPDWSPEGRTKVVAVVRRDPALDRDRFQHLWAGELGPAIQARDWSREVRGHVQSHTLPEGDPDDAAADGFAEFWFDDRPAARRWLDAYATEQADLERGAVARTDFMITYEVRKRP
jgi:hypothetical protein